MSYIIGKPCEATCDTACVAVCPVDCIHGPINPECIDCGACLPECPVEAIYEDEAVAIEKDGTDEYVKRNYKFFGLEFEG